MTAPKHTINVLAFDHPEVVKSFGFNTVKTNGQIPLRKGEFPRELWEEKKKDLMGLENIYCDFSTTAGCPFIAKVDLSKSIFFTKHYYNYLIYQYFKTIADVIHPNYIQSTELWLKDTTPSNEPYQQYYKFTLSVQIAFISKLPELVVSYAGTSKVLKKSFQELVDENIDTHSFTWFVRNGELIHYKAFPADANNYLSDYYPVINPELAHALHFPSIPPKRTDTKYKDYFVAVNNLLIKYLNAPEFLAIIPHSGHWHEMEEASVFSTSEGSNLLRFGHGTHTDPYEGLKAFKPCVPVPPGHYKFFFICHESDKETANLFDIYSRKKKGFINFAEFLSLPIVYEPGMHILFKDMVNPLPEIEARLSLIELLPDTHYLAIFISPYNKFETDPAKKKVYYDVKQILLKHSISSQVIHNKNINQENFKFSVSNIAVAILAKLGGIPWRLDREINDELIVGIGAIKTKQFNIRYIGSTFCFSNDGVFKGFDSFPADSPFLLAGEIRKAVEIYRMANKKAERIIIHFYKRMSQKEIGPIIRQLRALNQDIPVIIVSVNKNASSDLVLFDSDYAFKMPYSGTYISTGNHNYILCNNARYKPVMHGEINLMINGAATGVPVKELKAYPLPVKLHIQSTDPSLLKDPEQIKLFIDQVYQFSRMYWKSVSPQSMPVTTKYPELVAQAFPHFKGGKIPEFGKNNLWFL